MKKMLKNKKGFSLIELLIVIAIMGVLGVIAFNMFSGVINNSKKRADEQNAKIIEKAVISYIVDSGDTKLEKLWYNTVDNAKLSTASFVKFNPTSDGWEKLVLALQRGIINTSSYSATSREFGPYLSPKAGASMGSIAFAPQWNEAAGGDYVGYAVTVYAKSKQALVKPTDNAGLSNKITLSD